MDCVDLIRQYFEEYNSALTDSLISAEFTSNQARLFLVETEKSLIDSSDKANVFLAIVCLFSASPYQLPRNIDVGSIAKNCDIGLVQVTTGLHAIAPVLLQAISQRKPMAAHSGSCSLKSVKR